MYNNIYCICYHMLLHVTAHVTAHVTITLLYFVHYVYMLPHITAVVCRKNICILFMLSSGNMW